jgi:hypothetical protein
MTEADILARFEAIDRRIAGIAQRISCLEAAPAALRERPAAAGLTDERYLLNNPGGFYVAAQEAPSGTS